MTLFVTILSILYNELRLNDTRLTNYSNISLPLYSTLQTLGYLSWYPYTCDYLCILVIL